MAEVEDAFWAAFFAGGSLDAAHRAAGVSRPTAYRWWRRRFVALRAQGVSVRTAARQLRVPPALAAAWEAERRSAAKDPANPPKQDVQC
ncbi:MAG: hypothetical protein GEU78_14490 [Actinobacteria bacterium]|nr:hypothetical protein [Actinomycetota bacterium]